MGDAGRLRLEDPFTAEWTTLAPTCIVVFRSRFEVDFNRPRDRAVYCLPENAWGLDLWEMPLGDDLVAESLEIYDAFYKDLYRVLDGLAQRHGRFVLYDIHSYCHRRNGPNSPSRTVRSQP